MKSSYIENDYGSIFRSLILAQQPKLAVEFGVLDGYSTFYIANAMRFNKTRGKTGKLLAYDLWDDYEFSHGDVHKVHNMLVKQGLQDYVSLNKGDVFKEHRNFADGVIDFLHIDVSNDGDKLVRVLSLWGDKLSPNGMIAFEGGSEDRDKVAWMVEFGFPSIRKALMGNPLILDNWNFQIFTVFPSLTLLWRKNG